jgi:hypothetical protein
MHSQTLPRTPSESISWLHEQTLVMVGKLTLREKVIPSCYSHMRGTMCGHAITLHTHRFTGSVFRCLTLAYVRKQKTKELCGLALIGLPTVSSLLPIVSLDLRLQSDALAWVSIDLFPTDPSLCDTQAAPILQALVDRVSDQVSTHPRPTHRTDTLSPHALLCQASVGQQAALTQAIGVFLQQVTALCEHSQSEDPSSERAQRAWQAQRDWLSREQANRKESRTMSNIFGEPAAQRYLQDFLFNVPLS